MYNSIQHFLDFGIENIRETVKNFIEQGDDVANLVLGLQADIFELGRNIVSEVWMNTYVNLDLENRNGRLYEGIRQAC